MKKLLSIGLAFGLALTGVLPSYANYADLSHEMTGVNQIHKAGFLGEGTTIAFIDQGVNLAHPDFQGKVIDGYCAQSAPVCPNGQTEMSGPAAGAQRTINGVLVSEEDHGNMVAGIGAGNPSAESPGGVAPKANILMANTDLREDSILKALKYIKSVVQKHNIVAVSMSFGGGVPLAKRDWLICDRNPIISEMATVLKEIRDLGAIPFASAGNYPVLDSDLSSFPSCLKDVVSVGSVNELGEISIYVTMSKKIQLLGPDFTKAPATTGYRTASGTSAATPFVAGSYALLRSAFPNVQPEKLLEILTSTGRPVDDIIVKGKPLVNLPAAFQVASGAPQDFVACTNPKVTNVRPSVSKGDVFLNITVDPKCTGNLRVLLGSFRMANDLEVVLTREIAKKTTFTIKIPRSQNASLPKWHAVVTLNGQKLWERDYSEDCEIDWQYISGSGGSQKSRITASCPAVFSVTVGNRVVFNRLVSKSAIVTFSNPRNEKVTIRYMNSIWLSYGGR